ncbi:hypothetical protein D9758_018487 [Tetrapyrgos nigripes]|uniref:Uncharacterized protein n=1 Tax=Tetrapyrgos nigripes TaxID=182062 RepID=A0A8H5APT1_9AGAR|nr:hypothetical protein D9758_018487 [Tetrapyrgos nigripes]
MSLPLNDGHNIPTIAFGTGSKWKWHDVTTYVQLVLESGFSISTPQRSTKPNHSSGAQSKKVGSPEKTCSLLPNAG